MVVLITLLFTEIIKYREVTEVAVAFWKRGLAGSTPVFPTVFMVLKDSTLDCDSKGTGSSPVGHQQTILD